MVVCGMVCIVLGAVLGVSVKKDAWNVIRSPCLALFVFSLLGLLCGAAGSMGADLIASRRMPRKPPGEGEWETEAYVRLEGEDTEYAVTLSIPEQKYKRSQERELLLAAAEEMEQTFCGRNESLYEIVESPDVRESYQDGAVTAEWTFSERGFLSAEGKLCPKEVKRKVKDRQRVEASVTFSCGESKEEYAFCFWVVPGTKSRQEEVAFEVEAQIAAQDETDSIVTLPEQIGGKKAEWRSLAPVQPEQLLGLGVLAAAAVFYTTKEKKEKAREQRKRELLSVYPEFVSKLSLLLGAGMGISGALRKMDQMYQRQRRQGGRRSEVYEALRRMVCEMDNGMGELRAYQAFSEDCGLQPYRKLVSLLVSGQKVGNRRLLERLNEEADRVFAERKNAAKKLGEEAGIKMLLPMMMMLAVVMGIVIIPAFLSIYGI